MSAKLSGNEEALYKILTSVKLEVNKTGEINRVNLPGLIIKTMRHVSSLRVTGQSKKETVGNITLMLLKEYAHESCERISASEIDDLIEDLYATGVTVKKKCC